MKLLKFIFLGIFLLYFQVILAFHFSLFNVIPNFLIAYIIFINLELEINKCLPIAFLLGLGLDLLSPHLLGINVIAFLIISLLVSKNYKSINKKRLIVVVISIFIINVIYYALFILFHYFMKHLNWGFFKILLYSIIYNTVITFVTIYLLIFLDKIQFSVDV